MYSLLDKLCADSFSLVLLIHKNGRDKQRILFKNLLVKMAEHLERFNERNPVYAQKDPVRTLEEVKHCVIVMSVSPDAQTALFLIFIDKILAV